MTEVQSHSTRHCPVELSVVDRDQAAEARRQSPSDSLKALVRTRQRGHASLVIPGIGPFIAIVLVLELGDIARFASAKRVASYVGLTPP